MNVRKAWDTVTPIHQTLGPYSPFQGQGLCPNRGQSKASTPEHQGPEEKLQPYTLWGTAEFCNP